MSAPGTSSTFEVGAALFPLARGSDRVQVAALYTTTNDPDLSSAQVLGQIRIRF